jgi:hypothetical protein
MGLGVRCVGEALSGCEEADPALEAEVGRDGAASDGVASDSTTPLPLPLPILRLSISCCATEFGASERGTEIEADAEAAESGGALCRV